MTNKGKKLEPPLKLDISFGETLARALQTLPQEVEESIDRAKTKKPPETVPRRRKGSKGQSEDCS
jgi:hypothetical protein